MLFYGGNFGATISAGAIEDWGRTIDDPAQGSQVFAIDRLVKHESRTEMHVFNESGHFTYREHPEAFNRLVLDYVHGLKQYLVTNSSAPECRQESVRIQENGHDDDASVL